MPFLPRRPKGAVWGSRSADPSLNRTEAVCGLGLILNMEQLSNSRFRANLRQHEFARALLIPFDVAANLLRKTVPSFSTRGILPIPARARFLDPDVHPYTWYFDLQLILSDVP